MKRGENVLYMVLGVKKGGGGGREGGRLEMERVKNGKGGCREEGEM